MPQLIEQWRMKSAEGLAIGFICIWFAGDLFNLVGAIWAGLLPEVVFLAMWFCLADFFMIVLYVYYTYWYRSGKTSENGNSSENHETEPLVRRRLLTLTNIAAVPQDHSVVTRYVLPILFVVAAGVGGYFLSDSSDKGNSGSDDIAAGPQIVGYMSAALYLGARIPQILQNHRRRSVEGLSLLFFLFSSLGNLTYAGQILFFRLDSQYVLLNLLWLLGSLGTILEDLVIFLQFYMYKDHAVAVA